MLIRPAILEDAEAITRARVAAWQTAYRGLMPDAVLDGMDAARDAAHQRENLSALPLERYVFVGEIEGQGVAGFAAGGPCRDADPEYSGELYALYVHPRFQGAGLGRALVQAAEGWLRAHGHARMLVWVLRDNHPARRFYEATGGRVVREKQQEVSGVFMTEVGYGYELK